MSKKLRVLMVAVVVSRIVSSVYGGVESVPAEEAAQWIRWVIPLPKEIKIEEKVTLPKDQVSIVVNGKTGLEEEAAVREMEKIFGKTGPDGSFQIIIGRLERDGKVAGIKIPGAEELNRLPNREQSYLIYPAGDERIVLTGLSVPGVFYAALTLRQLLEGSVSGNTVSIPLAEVTDWPDIPRRGFFNSEISFTPASFLVGLKFNYFMLYAVKGVYENEKWSIPRLLPDIPYKDFPGVKSDTRDRACFSLS